MNYYLGDLHEQYARVCNQCLEAPPGPELLDLKEELERRLAEESMEEYGWLRDETWKWYKETPEQFAARYRAGREAHKEKAVENAPSFMKLSGSFEEAKEICAQILEESKRIEQKEHFIWKAKHQRGLTDE